MDIFLANEQDIAVDIDRLSALANHVLTSEEVDESAELSILFVTKEHMKRLNSHFAGDDYATDVLAFPMMEDEEDDAPVVLGDVVICPPVARDNAGKVGHSLTDELSLLVVHGTLHLLGYDHQGPRDKESMDKRQSELLASFDIGAAR
jgi:probable rRNA maturation factor